MTTSLPESAAQSISVIVGKDALDSLRSPENSNFGGRLPGRESIVTTVSELDDISLDDEPPSSSALSDPRKPEATSASLQETLPSVLELLSLADKDGAQAQEEGSVYDQNSLTHGTNSGVLHHGQSHHQKSASLTTIRSGRTLSLIDEKRHSARLSLHGQQALQEEFSRLQKEKQLFQEQGTEETIDWDFWGAVISDYQGFAAERPEELAEAIAKGVPATLRGMMWQHMAASKDPELESTYLKLLRETSLHEKSITRDLGRTFPHHAFFTDGHGIGQENLFNVLKAYSLHDPQVGYCQGLPFVVAVLLLNMPDEEAFSLLVRLMQMYDLRGHYMPEMPKLQMRLFQFDRLIEELLPVLHFHFLRQGIKSSMFCSQWFLTMFSYRFPLEIVFRIYDHCLANGIEAIFGFSIALLKKNEEQLLELKFDEILDFLNNRLLYCYMVQGDNGSAIEPPKYDVDGFVNDAVTLKITAFMLDCYRHEYEDMIREANKHAIQMDELRNNNRGLAQQCKTLENSFAQLNAEHVEILNELVKQRLRNEELESELVRYKLLYAEAMHQNEDAQSSQRLSFANMLNKRGSK